MFNGAAGNYTDQATKQRHAGAAAAASCAPGGGGRASSSHSAGSAGSAAPHLRRGGMLLLRRAVDLARRAPLVGVVGAIAVLLLLNTALQYAAGPALHRALPASDARRGGGGGPASGLASVGGLLVRRIPSGLVTDVVPGGADAELLCVDKQLGCDPGQCSKVAVKYQDCKATCAACEQLRASVQADTGLQLRVVQHFGPCQDLHPSCAAWQAAEKCSKDPRTMLELCQATCGFCLPPAASSLADLSGSSDASNAGGSSSTGGSGATSSSSSTLGLLDECQDDVSVCPFLALSGMCGSGSLWVETQCSRSCGHCTTGVTRTHNWGGGGALSGTGAARAGGPASSPQVVISERLHASPKPSLLRLYGAAAADGAVGGMAPAGGRFTSQALQEWPVPECRDHSLRCGAWAAAGECKANADYMHIACKASCGACTARTTASPFAVRQLSSGWAMPAVGFGTAGLGVGTAAAVEYAAAVGYRMFDTAESKDWYDEAAVGAGLAASGLPRASLFLASKIHPRDLGRAQTLAAFERSLAHLRTEYLDLLLLHYPACFPSANCIPSPGQTWQDSWQALEELVAARRVRSIGVSNFGLAELRELLSLARVRPAVLQARSDPFAASHHLLEACLRANITFVGYSSLGTQWINSPMSVNPVFESPTLQAVAARHPGKSVAAVVLRWALQLGQAVIPRSSHLEHIPDNLQLFDFSLSDADMAAMHGLDGTWKTGGLPLPVA